MHPPPPCGAGRLIAQAIRLAPAISIHPPHAGRDKSGAIVSDWESGKSDSYKNYLFQISALKGVSVEWLKGETDDPSIKKAPGINAEGLSAARKALLDAVDGLTDEQCEKLLGIVLEAKRVL